MQSNFLNAVKSFLIRWKYWIIAFVAVMVLFGAGMTIRGILNEKSYSNKKKDEIVETKNSGYSGDIFNASLPNCPSDLTGIFTHEVFDLAELDQVNPLGMLSPGGHTIPTDHMNLAHFGTKRIAIYSPGDVTLTFMDDKITYDANTNQKLHDDYSIEIVPCKGISVWLNHFSEVEPKILDAFNAKKKQCDTGRYHFGDDDSTYYSPCQTSMSIKLKSGELIGHVGTMVGGIVTAATGIDLGAYNFNTTPHAFANPARYEGGNLYSFCAIDLFGGTIKDAYYAKLGELYADGKSVYMIPRVGEPKCGTDMQDIPGTLAGNWFAGTFNGGGVTRNQFMLSLAHTLANANIEAISLQGPEELGGNALMRFTPKHTGTINREWSEVKPGDTVYCYQPDQFLKGTPIGKDGKPMTNGINKYIIQLVDNMHIRVERQSGACTGNELLTEPFIFER